MRSDDEEVSHHGRFTTDGANNIVYPDKYNNVEKNKKTVDINGKTIFHKVSQFNALSFTTTDKHHPFILGHKTNKESK